MTLFALTLIFFLIINPLGNIQGFLSLVKHVPTNRYIRIVIREMFFALILMVAFDVLGEYLTNILGFSKATICLSSGLILFLVALRIIFPPAQAPNGRDEREEPFFVPIAIPMIASPALLATIMLYASFEDQVWVSLAAILIAWFISCCVFFVSRLLFKGLGATGLNACEKLMGMVLILIAVQRVLEGFLIFNGHA